MKNLTNIATWSTMTTRHSMEIEQGLLCLLFLM